MLGGDGAILEGLNVKGGIFAKGVVRNNTVITSRTPGPGISAVGIPPEIAQSWQYLIKPMHILDCGLDHCSQ